MSLECNDKNKMATAKGASVDEEDTFRDGI